MFKEGFIPNPDNLKQFNKWQFLHLRKESYEVYEGIEAKEVNYDKEVLEEMIKEI
jgi:hypothetical protein